MKNEMCKTCRFWDLMKANGCSGICRRNAPIAAVPAQGEPPVFEDYPCWPLTLANEWCGEWQPWDDQRGEHDD